MPGLVTLASWFINLHTEPTGHLLEIATKPNGSLFYAQIRSEFKIGSSMPMSCPYIAAKVYVPDFPLLSYRELE
jgi:hypothetical protein